MQTRAKIIVPAARGVRLRRLKLKMPKDKFAALSTEFLDRVQSAMKPLYPPLNEEFQVKRDANDEILIRTNSKEFGVKVLPLKQQIVFSSPVHPLSNATFHSSKLITMYAGIGPPHVSMECLNEEMGRRGRLARH